MKSERNKAYRFRIYPDREQQELFARTFGCKRFVYNRMLSDKQAYYEKAKKMKRITPAGYKETYPWLREVDSMALVNAQLDLEAAFRKYFRKPGTGFPKYKTKRSARQSYTMNLINGNIRLERGKLVRVDRYYASSQICSCCGQKEPALKDLSIRKWICWNCGAEHDRDRNAAVNIRNEGMRIISA